MKKLRFPLFLFSSFFLLSPLFVFAAQDGNEIIDCNEIFEQRKQELMREIEKIDEEQQALQALQAATQAVLEKKETALKQKEQDLNTTMQTITQKEANVKKMLEANKKMLEEIHKAKDNKIAETYSKMRANKAAPILQEMKRSEAAQVMFALQPKVLGAILSQMSGAAAAELTEMLKAGPPFKEPVDPNAKKKPEEIPPQFRRTPPEPQPTTPQSPATDDTQTNDMTLEDALPPVNSDGGSI